MGVAQARARGARRGSARGTIWTLDLDSRLEIRTAEKDLRGRDDVLDRSSAVALERRPSLEIPLENYVDIPLKFRGRRHGRGRGREDLVPARLAAKFQRNFHGIPNGIFQRHFNGTQTVPRESRRGAKRGRERCESLKRRDSRSGIPHRASPSDRAVRRRTKALVARDRSQLGAIGPKSAERARSFRRRLGSHASVHGPSFNGIFNAT